MPFSFIDKVHFHDTAARQRALKCVCRANEKNRGHAPRFFTLRGRKFPHGNFRTSVFCEVRTQDCRKNEVFRQSLAAALFRAELYLFPFKDHIRRANSAHLATHRAGMTLGWRNLFIKALRLFRVERKRKLRRPVQLVACLRHRVVTVARARQAFSFQGGRCPPWIPKKFPRKLFRITPSRPHSGRGRAAAARAVVSKSGRAGL